jgi:opacity protein-like surface antigen
MQYIKKIMAGGLLAGVIQVTPAIAAEETAPVVTAEENGFYTGVLLGSRVLDAEWTTTEVRDPAGNSFDPIGTTTGSPKSSARDAGFLAGYNWAAGASWIVGVEADMQLIENRAAIPTTPGLSDGFFISGTYSEVKASDEIGLRGRAGWRADRTNALLYATVGISRLDVQATTTCPADGFMCAPFAPISNSESKTMNGETLGLGMEFTFGGMLLRTEWRRTDYGDFSFTTLPHNDDSFGIDADLAVETETFSIGLIIEL